MPCTLPADMTMYTLSATCIPTLYQYLTPSSSSWHLPRPTRLTVSTNLLLMPTVHVHIMHIPSGKPHLPACALQLLNYASKVYPAVCLAAFGSMRREQFGLAL